MSTPLSGERLLSLRATTVRWERAGKVADAKELAYAAREFIAEIDRLKAERERIRDYCECIRKSGNSAYAKAGRTLLEMFDGEATS